MIPYQCASEDFASGCFSANSFRRFLVMTCMSAPQHALCIPKRIKANFRCRLTRQVVEANIPLDLSSGRVAGSDESGENPGKGKSLFIHPQDVNLRLPFR